MKNINCIQNTFAKLFLLAILFGLGLSSCNKDDASLSSGTFEEVVEQGGVFSAPTTSNEITEVSEPVLNEVDGEIWTCTTETVSIQEGAGGNEGFSLFSPNSNVIYPGSLLQGKTLSQGTPDVIAVARAGGEISTDVLDGNIVSSFEVDEVSKSKVTDAINNIIAGSTGVLPANFNIKIENIQSREQFALSLGLDVNSTFVDVESKLNYSSNTNKNTFMVNLNQSFYTMSFNIPTSLDQIFDPSVGPEDLARYVGPGNPATYVSDVTYGRVYYMMIESSSSITEMDAAINASFNGVATQVDAEIEASYLSELNELKISVFAYGGESGSSLLTASTGGQIDAVVALLEEGSVIQAGKPISYVVRSVYDNQIVSTQLATNYDVTNCVPVGNQGAPPYIQHWTGNVVSSIGPIGAAFATTGTEFVLINKAGTQYLVSNTGTLDGPFPISKLTNEPLPFSGIGAACNIDGNNAEEPFVMVFDETGTQYTYFNYVSGNQLSIHPISDIANGSNPFNLLGIGAVAFQYKDSDGPSQRYMFSAEGDQYAHYSNNPNEFDDLYDLYYWGNPDGLVSARISAVGAAIGFRIGDDIFRILFDKGGTKYVVHGNGGLILGPFDL